jgi:murein L,D-transpeptidase YcbB/YkuD
MRRSRNAFAAGVMSLLLAPSLGGRILQRVPPSSRQPTYLGTAGLEEALAETRATGSAGEWPTLGAGPTLVPGERAAAIVALRARLAATGEAPAPAGDPRRYDDALAEAVRAFQRRHGLEADGEVGPATRAELDRSPRDRQRQIERTLASRRALPRDLGARFLLLNLPAFELEAIAEGRPQLRLRVVVGRPSRPTPTLVSAVRGIVVHPVWNVPPRIARQEIAPLAARDAGYLERLSIDVFAGGTAVAASAVDWEAFRRGEIDLELRQRPGPLNALGALSLEFPDERNICLHDTPDRSLFARARRDLSHGCVRVAGAVDLARWLVAGGEAEEAAALDRALAGRATVELALSAPVPIYVVDWSAWIDAEDELQLRPEIYPGQAAGDG